MLGISRILELASFGDHEASPWRDLVSDVEPIDLTQWMVRSSYSGCFYSEEVSVDWKNEKAGQDESKLQEGHRVSDGIGCCCVLRQHGTRGSCGRLLYHERRSGSSWLWLSEHGNVRGCSFRHWRLVCGRCIVHESEQRLGLCAQATGCAKPGAFQEKASFALSRIELDPNYAASEFVSGGRKQFICWPTRPTRRVG